MGDRDRQGGEDPRLNAEMRTQGRETRGRALPRLPRVEWPHLWILVAMIAAGGILHYLSVFVAFAQNTPLGNVDGYMHEVLMMVPVVYGGFIFGPRAGFITLAVVIVLMLPRDVLIAPDILKALTDTASITLVSSLVLLWFGGQQKEKKHREDAVAKLETARRELASHIDTITLHESQMAAINDVYQVIGSSLDLPFVLQRILDKTVEVMGAPAAFIFLKDKSGKKLELVAHKGVSQNLARAAMSIEVGEGFNGRVAHTGEPMIVDNALEDPRLILPQIRDEGLQSHLIVPLRANGQTIGTLCVALRNNRRFAAEEVELLTAIGNQVGIAIENARLYQETLTSQERYRDLFENATAAIFVHKQDGTITAANRACADLTGYHLEELIGMTVRKLFPASTWNALDGLSRKVLQGETTGDAYEIEMVRKDGTEVILSMTTSLISENNQPKGFQHIAQDITERRQARETLKNYVSRILRAQEDERKRISLELHDETAQSLLLISQRLDALTSDASNDLSPETRAGLAEVRRATITTLTDLRRFTQDLRPRILDDLGLVAALEWLADELQLQTGIEVRVETDDPPWAIQPETQLLLFRIAQEALSNVRRHAAASLVNMNLERNGERVRLTIEDNGRGFKLPANLADLATTGKLGILGMYERARLLNGTLNIRSELWAGTTLTVELPS